MTRLERLRNELKGDYTMKVVDMTNSLYRDFGNGFNVEIFSSFSRNLDVFLWFGDRLAGCVIAESVHDVKPTAEAIEEAVEKMRQLSEQLVAEGCNTSEKVFNRKLRQREEKLNEGL